MDIMTFLNISPENKVIFILLMVWTMIWKGLALWKAGRKNDTIWFVVLFLVSTVGILDILYFYHLSNRARKQESKNSL